MHTDKEKKRIIGVNSPESVADDLSSRTTCAIDGTLRSVETKW
jgi:hypothetical protein